jgi:hypothetical protein
LSIKRKYIRAFSNIAIIFREQKPIHRITPGITLDLSSETERDLLEPNTFKLLLSILSLLGPITIKLLAPDSGLYVKVMATLSGKA